MVPDDVAPAVDVPAPDGSAVDLPEDVSEPSEDVPGIDLAPDGLTADAALEEAGPVSPRCDGPCEWTPAELGARLVVWLDAAQLVTTSESRVAAWGDLSGWGNHAVQSIPGRRPVLAPHDFGSRPGIAFNPTADDYHFLAIPDGPSLRFGTDPFILVVVARTAYSGWLHAALWTKQEPDEPFVGPSLWLVHDPLRGYGRLMFQVIFDFPGQALTRADTFNQSMPFILTGRRDGATIRVRAGGVEDETVLRPDLAFVDVSAVGQPVALGASPTVPYQKVSGSYAEVIAIHGAITEEEQASLKRYLESKYAPAIF